MKNFITIIFLSLNVCIHTYSQNFPKGIFHQTGVVGCYYKLNLKKTGKFNEKQECCSEPIIGNGKYEFVKSENILILKYFKNRKPKKKNTLKITKIKDSKDSSLKINYKVIGANKEPLIGAKITRNKKVISVYSFEEFEKFTITKKEKYNLKINQTGYKPLDIEISELKGGEYQIIFQLDTIFENYQSPSIDTLFIGKYNDNEILFKYNFSDKYYYKFVRKKEFKKFIRTLKKT